MTATSELKDFLCTSELCNINKDDKEKSFWNECKNQVRSHNDAMPKNINNQYLTIQLKYLQSAYLYIGIPLQMFLYTSATNFRTVINNNRLNASAILNIESDLSVNIMM